MFGGIKPAARNLSVPPDKETAPFWTVEFPTGEPDDTLRQVIRYFKDFPIDAIGIGSFEPIDIRLTVKHTGASPRRRRQPGGTAYSSNDQSALDIPQATTDDGGAWKKLLSARPKALGQLLPLI